MKHAGYRVKVRYPHNKSVFYVEVHTGYFTPEWHLSKSHDACVLTHDRKLASIWPLKSRALTVAACVQAQYERDGMEASISVAAVSLRDGSTCWERVIR